MNHWTPVITAALMLAAWALRRFTPSSGFWHTNTGAAVIAFFSGLFGALAQAIQAHGFSRDTILPAVASFVMSFVATSNPTMAAPAPDARTKQIDGASLRALLPLAFLAFALNGCAHNALDGVRQSLIASSQMVKASADTFAASDLAYQRLLEKRTDGAAAIAKYRTDVQPKVLKAFVDAAATLSLGLVTVGAVDAGTKSRNDLGAVMTQVFQELQALQEALSTIAAPPPPLPVPVSWDHPADCDDDHTHCRALVLPGLQLPDLEVPHGV